MLSNAAKTKSFKSDHQERSHAVRLQGVPLHAAHYNCLWGTESLGLRRCLHDTRSSFIPVRLHPGSILSIYICLHATNQNCIPERVIPERLHPGSRIGSKFSFQNEICLHVPSVSCKGGTGSFRYGNKQVDWLG